MSLQPAQIEDVREIALLDSYAYAQTLCGRLNAVQETATVADIAEWQKVKNKFNKLAGGKLAFYSDKEPKRLAITNRVRRRLGLSGLDSEEDANSRSEICYSNPVDTEICGCD